MNIQKIIFIAVVMIASIGFLTYPVNAESGNIIISDSQIFSSYYLSGATPGNTINWTKIYFNNANYNKIDNFRIRFNPTTVTIPYNFNSSTFIITSGGSGSGYVWIDKNTTSMYWSFDSSSTFTSSLIILSYTSNNPYRWITLNDVRTGDSPSSIYPVCVGSNQTGDCFGTTTQQAYYENVGVSNYAVDSYVVNYLTGNLFSVSITKNTFLDSLYIIHSATTNYSAEIPPYNKVNITNAIFAYGDGLYLNATLSSGIYSDVLVNSTNAGIPTPSQTPTPNENGVGIVFNSPTYSLNDIANISWVRTVETPLLCTDYVRLQTPSSKYDLVASPPDSGYVKELVSIIGEYQTSFERDCLFSGTSVLDSDSASVGLDEQTSYVYAPAQVGVGNLFNVTYLIGWTKTSGSTVWLRDYSWDITTNSYSTTYQSHALSGLKGIETNQSILVTKTGKHLLKICDVLLGCKASTTTEAFFNGSEVTTNISVSNITIDKSAYSYGETILVKTAVDNFNWSDKQIVVEYEDYDEGIIQNEQYIQEQIESFPLYISDLTFSGSGASRLRLTGKNSTGSYILAYVNFTLSNVDSEGYGLSVIGDTNCIKDTVQINVIVPSGEVGNLTISADDAKYNKAYTVNGTKTISYKYQIDGTYYFTLSVNGVAKRVIIKVVSSTGDCTVPVPTTTFKGINGTWTPTNDNIKETCTYWDNWVRGIFGVQGVNDITRILFALGVIVAMMFIGLIASKGNFGVAIILGFFPYAFFTYLSISSPCGQYMPLWINIFIALIIGIKMKWFS